MNRKILEQLEFAKVKEQFQTYLQTDQAKIELQQLEPTTQISKLQDYITEVQEMSAIFVENHHFTIGSLRDLTEPIRRLELEADLNSQELLDIKRLLMISAEVSRFYQELENVDLVVLKRLFEKVETFPQLQGSLQAINDGGFIESFASPELATIRRKMTDSENQVRQLLQDILKNMVIFSLKV